jgi:hypothetical protein
MNLPHFPMKRLIALSSIIFLIPVAVVAQQFSKNDNAAQMRLGNDVYAAGNFLNITDAIEDDLFLVGNQITVQAEVGGDLHAMGSNLTVNGNIADDVRIAGGNVTVNGTIGGDLLVAGGTVYIGPNAIIEGNLLMGGGEVRIEGIVRGNSRISGGDVVFLGTTTGTANIRGENVILSGTVGDSAIVAANTLTIDPTTTVGGDLSYLSRDGEKTIEANVAGTTTFDPSLARKDRTREPQIAGGIPAALLGAISLFALFSAALSIGVFQFATKKFFIDCATRLRSSPGMSLLWGLIYFLLTPIVILLMMITIIGIPLALAVTACYMISLLFAQVLTAMVLARLAEKQWATKKKPWHPVAIFFAALGMWILIKLLWVIPVLGWLIVVLTVFATYGAVLSVKVERYKKVM